LQDKDEQIDCPDQDKEGKQGRRVLQSGEQEIWVRDLAGGAKAIGLFNRREKDVEMSLKWSDLGLNENCKPAGSMGPHRTSHQRIDVFNRDTWAWSSISDASTVTSKSMRDSSTRLKRTLFAGNIPRSLLIQNDLR
jgi:hypothetical protein